MRYLGICKYSIEDLQELRGQLPHLLDLTKTRNIELSVNGLRKTARIINSRAQ